MSLIFVRNVIKIVIKKQVTKLERDATSKICRQRYFKGIKNEWIFAKLSYIDMFPSNICRKIKILIFKIRNLSTFSNCSAII